MLKETEKTENDTKGNTIAIHEAVTSGVVGGRQQKTLKRHIGNAHGLSPEEYRTTFGLSAGYPMVAREYAQARSEMAKRIGLGQKGRGGRPAALAPSKPARRGRPPKRAKIGRAAGRGRGWQAG